MSTPCGVSSRRAVPALLPSAVLSAAWATSGGANGDQDPDDENPAAHGVLLVLGDPPEGDARGCLREAVLQPARQPRRTRSRLAGRVQRPIWVCRTSEQTVCRLDSVPALKLQGGGRHDAK